jgi:hypothetical protein
MGENLAGRVAVVTGQVEHFRGSEDTELTAQVFAA